MLPAFFSYPPRMNFLPFLKCLQGGQWSQSHKPWDAYILPVKKCTLFPRTQSLASGPRLASPRLGSSQQRRRQPCQRCGRRKSCILLRNLFISPSSPRQMANKCCISQGQLQSRSSLISLITSSSPCTRRHYKLSRNNHRCGRVYESESIFPPSVQMFQKSVATSRNPMTTTSAESMNAPVALASVRRRGGLSEREPQTAHGCGEQRSPG